MSLRSLLAIGHLAARLRSEADRLADQIEERFWWEEEGTYYLGLDGDKHPIDSVSSNPATSCGNGPSIPIGPQES